MKISATLFPFILGTLITFFVFQAFDIYQLRKIANDNNVVINQVVTFLNNQIQIAQQAAQPAKSTPVAPTTPTASTTKK